MSRRLTEILKENDDVISFVPGGRASDGRTATFAKIVVHDRSRVESEVLPRYFNHSSYASLRRQLNYFAFVRVGKGRQKGATYCNEGVVALEDILHLKRRVVGSAGLPAVKDDSSDEAGGSAGAGAGAGAGLPGGEKRSADKEAATLQGERGSKRLKSIIHSIVPVVHLPTNNNEDSLQLLQANKEMYHAAAATLSSGGQSATVNKSSKCTKTATAVRPGAATTATHDKQHCHTLQHSAATMQTPSIMLDLTVPSNGTPSTVSDDEKKVVHHPMSQTHGYSHPKQVQTETKTTTTIAPATQAFALNHTNYAETTFSAPAPAAPATSVSMPPHVIFHHPSAPPQHLLQSTNDIIAGCHALLTLGGNSARRVSPV